MILRDRDNRSQACCDEIQCVMFQLRESDQRAGNEIEIATGREADALKKSTPLSEGRAG